MWNKNNVFYVRVQPITLHWKFLEFWIGGDLLYKVIWDLCGPLAAVLSRYATLLPRRGELRDETKTGGKDLLSSSFYELWGEGIATWIGPLFSLSTVKHVNIVQYGITPWRFPSARACVARFDEDKGLLTT